MALFALIIAFILVAPLFLFWIKKNKSLVSNYDDKKKMLHLVDYPIIGASLRFSGDGEVMYAAILKLVDTYRSHGMLQFDMGMETWLVIFKAEYMQKILGSSKHLDKHMAYDFLHPWLRFGLLTSSGDKWAVRRKMLTPSFHYNILNDFIVVFNEQALVMCERLEERIGQGEFDIFPYITLCALDIICETAMGEHVNAQKNSTSEYVIALHEICDLLVYRQKSPWLWPNLFYNVFGEGRKFDKCLKTIHGFSNKVIANRQQDYDQHDSKGIEETDDSEDSFIHIKKKKRAFLDMLLYNWYRGELSTEDIQEEVDTFMFEGHDTTASGMIWSLYLIVSHPEVYKKVNQEIDEVFGDSNRPATMDDLKKLEYLEMALKEGMRLYPPVPVIGRKTTENVEIDGYTIPKDQTVTLLIGPMHRDERVYPDPLVYNPDRFLNENTADRHSFAFIPFSAGRRNCIGQKFAMFEEKTLLSWLFRRFKLETTHKEADLHPDMGLVLRPKYGIKIKVSKRE